MENKYIIYPYLFINEKKKKKKKEINTKTTSLYIRRTYQIRR